MELQFEKKISEHYVLVFNGSAIREENADMIVPDQSPDISRIIKGCANAYLKDKNAGSGKVDVSGNINGVVLYVAEGEKNIRKLDIHIPFVHSLEAVGITEESKICVGVDMRSIDVREINPRKVSVRITLEVSIKGYEKKELVFCGDVLETEKYGICVKKESVSVFCPKILKEKSFMINDDIELSGQCENIETVLYENAELFVTDTKVIGNKAILKGNALLKYMYALENGAVECAEHELSFSQIMDIEGIEQESDLRLIVNVTGVMLEPQYDASGVARYITAGIAAEAIALVYCKTQIDIVDDTYSTKYELGLKRSWVDVNTLHNKYEKRVAVNDSIQTENGMKQIIDYSVKLLSPIRKREEGGTVIGTDALVSIVYKGEDDSYYNASKRVNVVCPVPLCDYYEYETACEVRNKSFSVGTENEINIRFFTDFEITETECVKMFAINEISIDAEIEKKEGTVPDIIVKKLSENCDIWTLAKEHTTTVEEIKLANDIAEDEKLIAGRMVLIPIKK